MTEKEMNQITDTLLKLEANVNCGKMSPNDTAIAIHRAVDFMLDIYQQKECKKNMSNKTENAENAENEKRTVAKEFEHYSVWLRQEHHTQFRIPRSVANSLEEAIQLVRDNDEKIHEYNVYDCFEDFEGDEILEAEIDED